MFFFVVKKRSELLRFGLFLVVVGLLAWYVAGRVDLWRLSRRATEHAALASASPGTAMPARAEAPAGAGALDPTDDGRDYFAEYRMARERTRGALGERLKELMESAHTPDSARQQATEQYLKLGQNAALESQAEALVMARGFEDVIVYLADGSAQVVVRAAQLSQQQFLQVVDTVSRVTGVKSSAITVLAKYH